MKKIIIHWSSDVCSSDLRNRDLLNTGAMLYQLSYKATHWERGQFIEFICPVRSEMM